MNWFDLEERANLVREEISRGVSAAERDRLLLLEELSESRPPLRRRIATTLIRLGEMIDPLAVGGREIEPA